MRETLTRRNALRGIGGAGALALGGFAITSSSAASSINVTAGNVTISTDHGEIEFVSAQPEIDVEWDGFDQVVGKVRILAEARPHDVDSEYVGSYAPVFRATAWLNGTDDQYEYETGPGYHGTLETNWFADSGDNIVLYDRDGPDYGTFQNEEAYFDGTSVGQDANGRTNSIYDQAGTVDRFFNPTDGTTHPTTVTLRYTVSLHMGNSSSTDDYDVPDEFVQPNSPLVMADADDVSSPIGSYPPEAIPYDVLQDNADGHPAIMVEETPFDVRVENQPSQNDTSGQSGTGGSGSDDIGTATPE